MIKCENGTVRLKGRKAELRADLSVIVRALMESLAESGDSEEEAAEKIKESVRMGLLSEEEFQKEKKELADEISKVFDAILGELLK